MRLPSIKTLEKFGYSPELSRKIRKRMEDCRNTTHSYQFPSSPKVLTCLSEIDCLIGGNGIETIPEGSNQNSPELAYVNMGDTYSTTIIFHSGNFHVGNWGDIVERGNYQ